MDKMNCHFKNKPLAACVALAFSLTGLSQHVLAGGNLPVGNCLDDLSSGSLRVVAGGAATGDTIDMSALTCSNITLDAGSCSIVLPYGVTLQGPGADKRTIKVNQCPS